MTGVSSCLLKYGFCNKSFRKNETLTSWTLLQHIFPHFWGWLLLYSAITPKSEYKYVVKVFNWSEVHLSEMTCYKIHTLVSKWLNQELLMDYVCMSGRMKQRAAIWSFCLTWFIVIWQTKLHISRHIFIFFFYHQKITLLNYVHTFFLKFRHLRFLIDLGNMPISGSD